MESWAAAAEVGNDQRMAIAAWRRALGAGDVPLADVFRECPECFRSWSPLEIVKLGRNWGRLRAAGLNAVAVAENVNLAVPLNRLPEATTAWLIERLAGEPIPFIGSFVPPPRRAIPVPPPPQKKQRRRTGDPRLSAEPFAEWIAGLVARIGTEGAIELTGLHKDSVRALRAGRRKTIRFSQVDKALLHADTNIRDLYPELYDDEAIAA